MVSEKEIGAAREAWREYWSDAISQYEDNKGPMEGMRRALEAAARVRAEDNAGEPVAWRYRYTDPLSGKPVWRYDNRLWNGQRPYESQPLYTHPAPQPSGPVGALDEGLEILNGLIDNIKRRGNYSPEATCTFIDQAGQCLREALSALTAGKPEQSGWRPIETAPKDGTQFQAWIEKYGWEPHARFNPDSEAFELWGRVDYDKDGWDVYPHMVPTHWMPLPTPPTAGGGNE